MFGRWKSRLIGLLCLGLSLAVLAVTWAADEPTRSGEPALEADLSVRLTPLAESIAAGGVQLYEVAISNAGPGDATGVVVQLELPVGSLLLGTEPTLAGCSAVSDLLMECEFRGLAAGDSSRVSVGVLIDARIDGELSAEAVAAGDQPDSNAGNDQAVAKMRVFPPRALLATQRAGRSTLVAGLREGGRSVSLTFVDARGGDDRARRVEAVGYRATSMVEVPSFGATDEPEVAIAASGFDGGSRVIVLDSEDQTLLRSHDIAGDELPLDVLAVPSFGRSAAAELAVLLHDVESGYRVLLLDALSGRVAADHRPAEHDREPSAIPVDMVSVRDFGGSPSPELAIVTRSSDSGEVRVQLLDAATGDLVGDHSLGPGLFPLGIASVGDLGLAGGTTAPDLAVLALEAPSGELVIARLDSASGRTFESIELEATRHPAVFDVIENVSSSAAMEIVVAGRVDSGAVVVSLLDAGTGEPVHRVSVAPAEEGAVALSVAVLTDLGGGPAPDLAILHEALGASTRVTVLDARGETPLHSFTLP